MKKKPRVASSKTKSEPQAKPTSVSDEYRTWTSVDGKFSVEAKLLSAGAVIVELQRKDNGEKIRVPHAKLSPADRDFLRARR
jgi:hypothetical protein